VASSLIRCFLKILKYPNGISTERIFLRKYSFLKKRRNGRFMFGPVFTIHFLNFEVENSKFYRWGKLYQILISANTTHRAAGSLSAVVSVTSMQTLVPGDSATARVLSRRPKVASSSKCGRGFVVNTIYVSSVQLLLRR